MATRIFLCNRDENPLIDHFLEEAIESISEGDAYPVYWKCGNIRSVEVGDEVYFKRTQDQPLGYFAYGNVVAAPQEEQLRLQQPEYKDLSSAYSEIDEDDRKFLVSIEWESCVYFDEPLRTSALKKDPKFFGAYFDPQNSGGSFKKEYTHLLDIAWNEYLNGVCKEGKGASLGTVRSLKPTGEDSETSQEPTEFLPLNEGAGFGDSAKNQEVEQASIKIITQFYERNGWHVKSVERDKCGYDLICLKGKKREDVEVKGTSGEGYSFIVTAGEFEQAQKNPNFVLWIVSSVLSKQPQSRQWSGVEMLKQFDFRPISYRAKLR